ncbi:MAG: hypothetical protein HY302_04450 [Opitutae bacterium]|nr:hypothetical protein [Opitutae bacterium]
MRRALARLVLGAGLLATLRAAPDLAGLRSAAAAAEAHQDSRAALALYRQLEAACPREAFILRKISRQYSDLADEAPDAAEQQRLAQAALDYAQRAVAADPRDPVGVLSVAVSFGKLAAFGDTRAKVRCSRLVHDGAERALALDPGYAWAHHVLGRWHVAVATLGVGARVWVRVFYGGMPAASVAEGIRQLQLATELEPGELSHFLELGFAWAADGRRAEAEAAWRHGLAMPSRGPHDDFAKRRAQDALANYR